MYYKDDQPENENLIGVRVVLGSDLSIVSWAQKVRLFNYMQIAVLGKCRIWSRENNNPKAKWYASFKFNFLKNIICTTTS